METAESKYIAILEQNDNLVDYVEIVEDIIARRDGVFKARSQMPDTLSTALEFDLIQVKGFRQSGHTLAIQTMAGKDDLVFLRDTALQSAYMDSGVRNPEAVVIVPTYSAFGELRANSKVLKRRMESGEMRIDLPEGFKPKRIFVDDATHVFKENYDARSLIRWARARFGTSPIIIGLG